MALGRAMRCTQSVMTHHQPRLIIALPRSLQASYRYNSGSTNGSGAKNSVLRVIRTNTDDPFFNLSYEECLLNEHSSPATPPPPGNEKAPAHHTLFLWRNAPSVIIGRFQNPYKECFVQRMEEKNVNLVRRKSGGGAVYQDFGNSIFSFISPEPHGMDGKTNTQSVNNDILLAALKSLGVTAQASGRNDIITDGKKISGCAFKRERQILLHHGTMLIDVDFGALAGYLNPNKAKLESKGVKSVAARVLNLKTIIPSLNHDIWCDALTRAFLAHHGNGQKKVQIESVDHSLLNTKPELKTIYDGMKNWEWRFGTTPSFTHHMETRFVWGIMDVHINSDKGVINNVVIHSDSLYPWMIEVLQTELRGVRYNQIDVAGAIDRASHQLQNIMPDSPMPQHCKEFAAWLVPQL